MAGMKWFWKALGAKETKHEKKSLGIAEQAQQILRSEGSALGGDHAADVAAECLAGSPRAAGTTISDMPRLLAAIGACSAAAHDEEPFISQYQAAQRLLAGDVIQMATGEGKTLAGAMAAVGFALQGQRVHVITVNDYLAQRDATRMESVFRPFGVSVSFISEKMTAAQRRHAYAADVVYSSVNEIGFDVLRDQLITRAEDAVQSGADVAIVDEADSVLVDQALVPLVLAGTDQSTAPTGRITEIVRRLKEGEHFDVDDERRNVFLNDAGAHYVEEVLGIDTLYDEEHIGTTLVHVNLALHAQALLIRDVHYIVREGKVSLIDASRGRVADLQRWPDGLQAAVEAKEGLVVSDGGRILDTITLQALMKRYPLVCGMTGTAVEATDQLRQFYDLRVSVIERDTPLQRFDEQDRIYATIAEKNKAIVEEIDKLHRRNQPVLVGTHDVAESEELAAALAERDIPVSVLNAKNDAEEATIVAEAGDLGRVTVSTQMAGRGTDIRLGGADEADHDAVVERGGLAVIGTARHRTARLDNQLRGRAGRQGDPGSSVFFVALDDDVVHAGGGGTQIHARPDAAGAIDSKKVRDFIEHCQRVTEGQLLEIHAQTWKYNKLLADQRVIIDERRQRLLHSEQALEEFRQRSPQRAAELEETVEHETLVQAAREIMLYHLDYGWSEHLALLDDVRESIHLRAIAKETPIDEFHRIAVSEFKQLVQQAVDDAVQSFEDVLIDNEGAHLGDEGLVRPSATWTYMVNDNPLSGSGNSVMGGISGMFR
ncbi:accessory Sec system translocase SecA2 [Corynebacterium sp. TAE3-ERU2]|uniref:accessory Sec system translocase SecA2 n=1 Tax=Corynebacterium sp. TAE3-ERU2 TaxID=2849497 RepID=UPI001C460900|nr:accessory Sec system translocase SecA2 [Corynebacterium sp. TAE3-ERU2]